MRAADADLPLGHRLEQGRLHLGRRPVDLVGEHQVGEDRPELGVEALGRRPPDPGADDVAGHQVGGELQPGEAAADDVGQGAHGERLGHPGHALEQEVAAGEQSDQHPFDHEVLADDDALDLEQRALEHGAVGRRSGWAARRCRLIHQEIALGGLGACSGGSSSRGLLRRLLGAVLAPSARPAASRRSGQS